VARGPLRPTAASARCPLHRYLYATAPYPWLQDEIIQCESGWETYAYNGWSGASGLAQFLPSTFYGVSSGYIWNPYDQIDAMNEMIRTGRIGEWSCYWVVVYGWNPD
jgi:hypothetical protein